jgi:hypothetical protein
MFIVYDSTKFGVPSGVRSIVPCDVRDELKAKATLDEAAH